MQALENEFENLITGVIRARLNLLKEGLEKCGCTEEWLKNPENAKRCKIIETEDTVNCGFKTLFFMDDKLIFEVVCTVNHKTMNVNSELKMIKDVNIKDGDC